MSHIKTIRENVCREIVSSEKKEQRTKPNTDYSFLRTVDSQSSFVSIKPSPHINYSNEILIQSSIQQQPSTATCNSHKDSILRAHIHITFTHTKPTQFLNERIQKKKSMQILHTFAHNRENITLNEITT